MFGLTPVEAAIVAKQSAFILSNEAVEARTASLNPDVYRPALCAPGPWANPSPRLDRDRTPTAGEIAAARWLTKREATRYQRHSKRWAGLQRRLGIAPQ